MNSRIGAKLELHYNWKGGVYCKGGYILIKNPEHPYRDKRGYVREHRLVMETYLGRYLTKNEEIHHINNNRKDNRIQNLLLLTKGQHTAIHNKINEERSCLKCGSDKTYIQKRGKHPVWYKKDNGFICQKCRDMLRYNQFRKGVIK